MFLGDFDEAMIDEVRRFDADTGQHNKEDAFPFPASRSMVDDFHKARLSMRLGRDSPCRGRKIIWADDGC
jgi:hypothetical protein